MRTLFLAVVASLAAGCGRGGDGDGLGSSNEGIQNGGGSNGCVVPTSHGWSDPHDALANGGTTGDFCAFDGAGFASGRGAACLNHHLIVETQTGADFSFCGFGDGGTWPPQPQLVNGCVESCEDSGGAVVSCLALPAKAPSRSLSFSWSLNAASDCTILMQSCPEVGDSCTGSTVCAGLWHPDQPNGSTTISGLDAALWCDNGVLQIVMTD